MKRSEPKFHKYLLFFMVIGAAIGINGLFIIDEIFFICLIVYLLKANWNYISSTNLKKRFLEISVISMLIASSFIGLITVNLDFIDKIRYLGIYLALLIFYLMKASDQFDLYINSVAGAKFIVGLLVAYFIATLIQGLILDYLFGLYSYSGTSGIEYQDIQGRYYSQGTFWVGSAYFSIPTMYLLYMLTIRNISTWPLIYVLILSVSIYFESRTMMVMLTLYLPALLMYRNKKNNMLLKFLILASIIFFALMANEEITTVVESVYSALIFNPRDSDVDRLEHFYGIFKIYENNPWTAIFGGGWQSHKLSLSAIINNPSDITRTTGMVSLAIDTGLIGLLFYVLLQLIIFKRIISRDNLKFKNIYVAVVTIFCINTILYVTFPWESILFLVFLMSKKKIQNN